MIKTNLPGSMNDFSGQRLGNYRLIRLLGQGGFASVYLGEHLYLKRPAAIKVLRAVLTEKEQERFLKEARLLANLSHPHIIRVLEFAVTEPETATQHAGVQENTPFLVMDYAPFGSLRTLYPAGRFVPLNTVIHNVRQAAEALQYAHEQNIIHRDIKPENLLMNERQEVMLSDFGLALFAPAADFLSLQGIAGTLRYAAPEQLQGKPTFASDQYALGIVAYEWLCGSRPFAGDDVEVIMQHVSAPPPRLRSKNPSISSALEGVVLKSLAKDPEQRHPTILDFAKALEGAARSAHSSLVMPSTRKLPAVTAQIPAIARPPSPERREFPVMRYLAQKAAQREFELKDDREEAVPAAREDNLEHMLLAEIASSMQRNRLRMIHKVRAYWIRGVLKQSLQGGSFISLALDERQDAVATAWPRSPQSSPHRKDAREDARTPIVEIYDQAGGELLILGEAGSGKTTLLLELARHLLERAEQDEAAPVPVVFMLASWAEKQLPLDQWLVEDLYDKYQVPRPLGETWVRNEMLLPLLDGLDEVAAPARSACVTAINTYKKQHGLSALVVGSRLTEYLLFPPRVLLHNAVVLRPLTTQQIEEYLHGENLAVISQMLRDDLVLQRLVTTPLMLTIIARTYRDKSPEDLLLMQSPTERYQRILGTYVEQMLRRHSSKQEYPPQQVLGWLAHLARRTQRAGQRVFYIEHMQPDWIDQGKWSNIYRWLAVFLPGMIIGALTGVLSNVLLFHAGSIGSVFIDSLYGMVLGYLFSGRRTYSSPVAASSPGKRFLTGEQIRMALVVGLLTFVFFGFSKNWAAGVANGLAMGLFSVPLRRIFQQNRGIYSRKRQEGQPAKAGGRSFPLEHLTNGTLAGLACGLTSIVTLWLTPGQTGLTFTFLLSLYIRDSLRNALLGTLLSMLLVSNNGSIRPAEVLSWSWKRFLQTVGGRKNLLQDLLFCVIIAIVFSSKQLFQGNMDNVFSAGLSAGIFVTIGMRLVYGLLQGISRRNLDNRHRYLPNEGMRRSFYYSLLGGAIGIVVVTVLSVVTTVINTVLSDGLTGIQRGGVWLMSVHLGLANALLLGPAGGLLIGLLLGGLACVQHGVLRVILWKMGVLPLKPSRFLDYAADSVLLHRVGGGYIFVHRLLLEYFAGLDEKSTPASKPDAQKPASPEAKRLVKLL